MQVRLLHRRVCEPAPTARPIGRETGIGSEASRHPVHGISTKASYKKNVRPNFWQDFAFVAAATSAGISGKSPATKLLYEADNRRRAQALPRRDGISNGMVLATSRLLLSYDRAFSHRITLGIRAGYAFGGGPPAGQRTKRGDASVEHEGDPLQTKPNAVGTGGTAFLPAHVEVRGAFWFLPLSAKLLRAYVERLGGMAQVDAK